MAGERQAEQQHHRVGQVQRHHHCAREALVVGNEPEQDEPRAKQRLDDDEDERGDPGPPGVMAGRHRSPDPDGQHEHEHQRQAARDAVRELDQRRGVGRAGHHFPVAERPVGAAASARAGGTHIGAPQDDGDVPGEHGPGEAGESGVHRETLVRDSGFGIRDSAFRQAQGRPEQRRGAGLGIRLRVPRWPLSIAAFTTAPPHRSAAVDPPHRATRGGIISPVSEPSWYSGQPVPGSGPSDNGRHVNSDPADASYWQMMQ